jgi:hypothetical protein
MSMSEKFEAVATKLDPLLRMLTSNVEQEVLTAVRMMLRLLASVGLDIHAIAERLKQKSEPLNSAEMQRIYDAAYSKGFNDGAEHGRKSVILAGASPHQGVKHFSVGVNGYSLQGIAAHCARNIHLFIGREVEFVESINEQLQFRSEPTEPQARWLRDLFTRKLGGKIT